MSTKPQKNKSKPSAHYVTARAHARKPAPLPELLKLVQPTRMEYIFLGVLALLYFLSRLIHLTLAGMSIDETNYLYWGLLIDGNWKDNIYASALQGKPPLHSWLIAIFQATFANPVWAGRFVSVLAGFITLLALAWLAWRLFSPRVALLAAIFYIVVPYTLLYDRQALSDSLFCAAATMLLACTINIYGRHRIWSAVGVAITLAAALLTKPVGWLFPPLLLVVLFVIPYDEQFLAQTKRWLFPYLGGAIAGILLYLVIFGLHPAASTMAHFEQQYGKSSFSLAELIRLPWQTWLVNGRSLVAWLSQSLTWPLLIAALIALVASPWMGRRAWPLAIYSLVAILGLLLSSKVFLERHILFCLPSLLILLAGALERGYDLAVARLPHIQSRYFAVGGVVVCLLLIALPAYRSARLVLDFNTANTRQAGYYGLNDMVEYLTHNTDPASMYVVVNAAVNPVADGTAVLLAHDPRFHVLRLTNLDNQWTLFDAITQTVYPRESFNGKKLYYVADPGDLRLFWLADYIETTQTFSNHLPNNSTVGLYTFEVDATFK